MRDSNRRRDTVDSFGLGLFQPLEELPSIRREALDVPALTFGIQSIESQARFAATTDAANDDQLPQRHIYIDMLQVVNADSPQLNLLGSQPLPLIQRSQKRPNLVLYSSARSVTRKTNDWQTAETAQKRSDQQVRHLL